MSQMQFDPYCITMARRGDLFNGVYIDLWYYICLSDH